MWVVESLPYLSPRETDQVDAWTDEARQAGRTGTQHLREVLVIEPPSDVAEALSLSAGETAVLRRRTILLDGEPVELADSWYPASIAVGTSLAEQQKIKGGAVTLLAGLGYIAHEAREDISFRTATEGEAEILTLTVGSPVIVLLRTVLTDEGLPFEVSVMTMVAEGRHLRYRLTVG